MTGSDILYAIAGADEKYVRESEQFSVIGPAIEAERKRKLWRGAFAGMAAAACLAVLVLIRYAPRTFRTAAPAVTTVQTPVQTPEPAHPSGTTLPAVSEEPGTALKAAETASEKRETAPESRQTGTARVTERQTLPTPTSVVAGRGKSENAPSTKPQNTTGTAETTTAPYLKPERATTSAAQSTAATTTVDPGTKDTGFFESVVDFDTARRSFAHPIVPCERAELSCYSILTVRDSAGEEVCRSVIYVFENGNLWLTDQDRQPEPIYPTGDRYEYLGRTFHVRMPEFNGDRIRVEYYPTGQSGIAYQASFDSRTALDDITDLILSLEI